MNENLGPLTGILVKFTASNGERWTVQEFAGDGTVGNGGDPSLVFGSDAVMRRVRRFPSNWRELDPDQLLAISWNV